MVYKRVKPTYVVVWERRSEQNFGACELGSDRELYKIV